MPRERRIISPLEEMSSTFSERGRVHTLDENGRPTQYEVRQSDGRTHVYTIYPATPPSGKNGVASPISFQPEGADPFIQKRLTPPPVESLSERLQSIVRLVESNNDITARRVAEVLNLKIGLVDATLYNLYKRGVINRKLGKRGKTPTTYSRAQKQE